MQKFKLSTHDQSDKAEPHWSEVQYYVDVLKSIDGAFLVLETEPPVNNVVYIQAAYSKPKRSLFKKAAGEPYYIVETQTAEANGELYQHSYETFSQAEVEAIFEGFLVNHEIPDLGRWQSELFYKP